VSTGRASRESHLSCNSTHPDSRSLFAPATGGLFIPATAVNCVAGRGASPGLRTVCDVSHPLAWKRSSRVDVISLKHGSEVCLDRREGSTAQK
jgi:hypothetical protein